MSYKQHYSRFLEGLKGHLHFAAHSHHAWPDCTRDAVLACWDDAARQWDGKWDHVMGPVLLNSQTAVADAIRWTDPSLIAFAPNTHEFVLRLISCAPPMRPPRVLTTDSEFHSFTRQTTRLQEDGAQVQRVPVEPFASFVERFCAAAKRSEHDLVFLSQVFFNSGFRLNEKELTQIAAASGAAIVAVDGYHAFMAVPVDLSKLADRIFYIGGGYKYAQTGEGACFLAVPKNCTLRPANTGWFADFAGLEKNVRPPVGYGEGAYRFWGSTFDPTGLYRFNAVSAWRKARKLTVEKSDAHVRTLQRSFLTRLGKSKGSLTADPLLSSDLSRLGHFLTFRRDDAGALCKKLAEAGVITDSRGDRLRFGFGLYQDEADLKALFIRLERL